MCYYLDEGKQGYFAFDKLYYLADDFLRLKFQVLYLQTKRIGMHVYSTW